MVGREVGREVFFWRKLTAVREVIIFAFEGDELWNHIGKGTLGGGFDGLEGREASFIFHIVGVSSNRLKNV